jgi:uncharacterized Zn finger protein
MYDDDGEDDGGYGEAYGGYDWYGGYGFKPYVTVAGRRRQAATRLAGLRKKGRTVSPVAIDGRKIARTFWGEAWCENLERYSDFANRLPRGRTYVRNGSVIHLDVAPGVVTALVSGSRVYEVRVAVAALPKTRWRAVCRDVAGAIDSVIELLQGRLSDRVMTRLCEEGTGLFPSPREIQLSCSCPDWASMCKHVAAVLYGIGARLDSEPALLFTLRKVKEADLVGGAGARAAAGLVKGRAPAAAARKVVEDAALGDVFGIDIAPPEPKRRGRPTGAKPAARKAPASSREPAARAAEAAPAKVSGAKTRRIPAAERARRSAQMRRRWAKARRGR